jgi:hypothetical protein
MAKNVIQEALEEVYPEFEREAHGGYGAEFRKIIDGIFEPCECDKPVVDVDYQLERLIDDISLLQEKLRAAVLAGNPAPKR